MKVLAVFLAIVIFVTLSACGTEEVEVTRAVEVTRIVKETITEQVDLIPAFDAEAETAKLEALSVEYYDAFEVQDREVHRRLESEDWIGFYGFYDYQGIGVVDENTYVPNPDVIGTKITIDNREWIISPELAVAKSRESWLWPGEPSPSHYLLTMVWQKMDDQWKLVHEHVSEYTP